MKIKTTLAINNKNGLNALKEIKKMDIFQIKYLILHPEKKAKYRENIIEEAKSLHQDHILSWEKSNRKAIYKTTEKENMDLLLSVNFGYIFKPDFLKLFKEAINLHTGYLPYNKGAHPNVWPIIDGTPAGVTLHTMDAEIDKGKIIYQEKIEVEETDTGKSLYEKLEKRSLPVLKKGLEGYFNGEIIPFKPKMKGTYHTHKEFLELFEIDTEKKEKAGNFIQKLRALSFPPYKNAYYVSKNKNKIGIDIEVEKIE